MLVRYEDLAPDLAKELQGDSILARFFRRTEDYYGAEYKSAAMVEEIVRYIGRASKGWLQCLFAALRDEYPLREAAMTTSKLPDVAAIKACATSASKKHDAALAAKAESHPLMLEEPEGLDIKAAAELAGIDTTADGWLVRYLFNRIERGEK